MTTKLLKNLESEAILARSRVAVDERTLAEARGILSDVKRRGREAVLEYGRRFRDLGPDGVLVLERAELEAALDRIPAADRALLERTAERIALFARAQRESLADRTVDIEGGRGGWRTRPVGRAGCYAPGGRFPLPSSVLMTAVTAREAGVPEIWVASPAPGDLVCAAAAVAGASCLLASGGAQAVGALAYGIEGVPACDVIVGPGNRWVTAAKQLVSGHVGIDMLAGPSELVVLADASADAGLVAADLLAQAEHDPDAIPILVALDEALIPRVESELQRQLADLSTAETARAALEQGGAVLAADRDEAVRLCDALAPEHLEVIARDATGLADRLASYGALFVGAGSAEVLGDYGAGPNHVLPTGGTARFRGGLSVQDFLVTRTWLQVEPGAGAEALRRDAIDLARLEGLEAHARAAEQRRSG